MFFCEYARNKLAMMIIHSVSGKKGKRGFGENCSVTSNHFQFSPTHPYQTQPNSAQPLKSDLGNHAVLECQMIAVNALFAIWSAFVRICIAFKVH